MTTFLYNKIKLQSITLFLINKYNLKLLSSLYKEYISKQYTKNQYLLVLLLCKSYDSNNIYEGGILYNFIDYYVRNYNSQLFKKLIFE